MLDEKSSNTASVVVLCTAPDEATAQDLAAKVLAEKLAACATLIPGATSLYYWEGKLEQEYEVQMILKMMQEYRNFKPYKMIMFMYFLVRLKHGIHHHFQVV